MFGVVQRVDIQSMAWRETPHSNTAGNQAANDGRALGHAAKVKTVSLEPLHKANRPPSPHRHQPPRKGTTVNNRAPRTTYRVTIDPNYVLGLLASMFVFGTFVFIALASSVANQSVQELTVLGSETSVGATVTTTA